MAVDYAMKSQAANDRAEFNSLQADLKIQMLEQNGQNMQVKGRQTLADPNAVGPWTSPKDNLNLNLFERTKQSLSLGKDEFLTQASNERVRKALSAEYDQQSVELLGATLRYQIEQQREYQEASKKKASAAVSAQVVAAPSLDLQILANAKAEFFDIYEGNPQQAEQDFNATLIEAAKQQARKNVHGTENWVKQNEEALDRLAPGVYTKIQDEIRDEKKYQRREKIAQREDAEYYRQKARRAANDKVGMRVATAIAGKEKRSDVIEFVRQQQQSGAIDFTWGENMIAQLTSSKPTRSQPFVLNNHAFKANEGLFDTEAAKKDVEKGVLSIQDYTNLSDRNKNALERKLKFSYKQLQVAQTQLRNRFKAKVGLGFDFENQSDVIRSVMAENMLLELYDNADDAGKLKIFTPDANGMYPVIEDIFRKANEAPIAGYTRSGVKVPQAGKEVDYDTMDAIAEGRE
jgi:hypothetical protein